METWVEVLRQREGRYRRQLEHLGFEPADIDHLLICDVCMPTIDGYDMEPPFVWAHCPARLEADRIETERIKAEQEKRLNRVSLRKPGDPAGVDLLDRLIRDQYMPAIIADLNRPLWGEALAGTGTNRNTETDERVVSFILRRFPEEGDDGDE